MQFYFVHAADPRLKRFSERISQNLFTLAFPDKTIDIAIALEVLWNVVCKHFKTDEQPRGIDRHKLVSTHFASRTIKDWRLSGTPADEKDRATRLSQLYQLAAKSE